MSRLGWFHRFVYSELGAGRGGLNPAAGDFQPTARLRGRARAGGFLSFLSWPSVGREVRTQIVVGIGLGMLLVGARAAQAQTVFGDPVSFPLPRAVPAMLSGDFDGDGKPDLALLMEGPPGVGGRPTGGSVRVLLSAGRRTFIEARDTLLGIGPEALAAADFNRDGHLDLAVAFPSTNTVSLLLGQGDGTFALPLDFLAGQAPLSLTAGDLNGDGFPDLAVADYGFFVPGSGPTDPARGSSRNGVEIWAGNGKGGFSGIYPYELTAPLHREIPANPRQILQADLNGKGSPDLVTANGGDTRPPYAGGGSLSVLFDPGTPQPTYALYPSSDLRSVAAGDFNGDGRTDLAAAGDWTVSDGSTWISVWLNSGSGLVAAPDVPSEEKVELRSADMNGDGKADLVVRAVSGIEVLPSRGDGTFGDPEVTLVRPRLTAMALADFDGDGHLDAAVARTQVHSDDRLTYGLALAWGERRSDTLFTPPMDLPVPSTVRLGGLVPTHADFNGDGIDDLAVRVNLKTTWPPPTSSESLGFFYGRRDGTFEPPTLLRAPLFPSDSAADPQFFLPGDFNGDGKPDLLAGLHDVINGKDSVAMLLNQGDGTYARTPPVPIVVWMFGSWDFRTGDFNGDGKTDLIATGWLDKRGFPNHELRVMLSNGDGSFRSQGNTPVFPYDFYNFWVEDFNGDGKGDVVLQLDYPLGEMLHLFPGNAQGDLIEASNWTPRGLSDIIQVGDFTGDGKPDLLGSGSEGGVAGTRIYPGNGDGTFGAGIATTLFGSALLGDFNGDGLPDVIGGDATALRVDLGTGQGQFRLDPGRYYTPYYPNPVKGDFNSDGRPDLAYASGDRVFLRWNATGVKKGDLNGDGAVTVADALVSLRRLAGLDRSALTPLEKAGADMDNDSVLTVRDTLLILKAAAGL